MHFAIARCSMTTFWRRHDRTAAQWGDAPTATERLWQRLSRIGQSERRPDPTLEAALVRQMVVPMACLAAVLGTGYSVWQCRALDALFETQGRAAAWQVAAVGAASGTPSATGPQPLELLPSDLALQAALRNSGSQRIEICAPEPERIGAGLSLDALGGMRRFVVAWPPADGSTPSLTEKAMGANEAARLVKWPAANAP